MRARDVPVMLTSNVVVVRRSGEIDFFVTSADVVHSTRLRNPFGE
jgi:heme/copper-type cytochrome/quinol oxidase subunit 2